MGEELFPLERGTPNKLEGRVLIYTSVDNPHCEYCRYPCLYVGSHPFDVLDANERATVGEELLKHPSLKDTLGPEGKPILGISIRPLEIRDPQELVTREGDILHAGRFMKAESAFPTMHYLGRAYMARYVAQWEARMQASETISAPKTEDLTSYAPPELQLRLYALMGELMDGISQNDPSRVRRVEETLTTFGGKTNYRNELERLISFAKSTSPNNILLTQKQVDIITAIRAERYEDALRLRDEIKALAQ